MAEYACLGHNVYIYIYHIYHASTIKVWTAWTPIMSIDIYCCSGNQAAVVLLVGHHPRVPQHLLRRCGALQPTGLAFRIPTWVVVVVVVYHVIIVAIERKLSWWRNFGVYGKRLRSTHCREFHPFETIQKCLLRKNYSIITSPWP